MMRPVASILAGLSLSACISVHQTPLPDNSALAVQYPKLANGERLAEMGLATNFQRGYGGVGANEAESLRYWLDLAETGHLPAQMALGIHYQATDRDKAAYWYRRAADAGHKQAPYNLAQLNANPRNGAPDYLAALKWAYVADSTTLINQYQKQLTPEAQAEARRQADDWKRAHPPKDKQ